MDIPERFAKAMREVYGAAGDAWLVRLPAIIADCERRWGLTVGSPFTLSYNYVAPATRADGTPVVLKVGYPSRELFTEANAMQIYNGRGIAQMLDYESDWGAMLLERLLPGTTLATVREIDDDQATRITAEVMLKLWQPLPPDHLFPTTADWAKGMQRMRTHFNGGIGPFPQRIVEMAERLFAELLASSTAPVLLHGDLHHENILAAERAAWLALDPKGLAGEPAYEVGALFRNTPHNVTTTADLARVQARRADILAEMLGIDRQRILGWSVAQAVLSGWWMVEDHGYGWEEVIANAEVMAGLMKDEG